MPDVNPRRGRKGGREACRRYGRCEQARGCAVWFATSPDMPAHDTPDAAIGQYAQSIMAVLKQNGFEKATVAS